MSNAFRKFNSKLKSKGRKMYSDGLVTVNKIDKAGSLTEVAATVRSSSSEAEYEVFVCFDEDGNIVQAKCTCPSFDAGNETCSHIATVIYAYMDQIGLLKETEKKSDSRSLSELKNNTAYEDKTETSDLVMDFISSFHPDEQVPYEPVVLYPCITDCFEGGMYFSFKIGRYGSNKRYAIRNIDRFLDIVRLRLSKRFGGDLDLRFSINVFDECARKIIRMLNSVKMDKDLCEGEDEGLHGFRLGTKIYRNLAKGEVSLRGRYLDEMIAILKDTQISAIDIFDDEIPVRFEYHDVPFHSYIYRKDNHYVFHSEACEYAEGIKYLYFMDYDHNVIHCSKTSENIEKFYGFLLKSRGKEVNIAEKDMYAFVKCLYPLIKDKTILKETDFHVEDFILPSPEFEIYLDCPDGFIITCRLKAVYGKRRYDLFSDTESEKRDNNAESSFSSRFFQYFTAFNSDTSEFVFYPSTEESIFKFLGKTIPELHKMATVYVSDVLNRIRVIKMPTVTFGISVKKDLLQLKLSTSDLTLKEVSEILSKYDRKKKYCRLKNGTFISMDNNVIDEILNLKDALALSISDISKGKIRLPRYRALYIEAMSKKKGYNISCDEAFHKLIETIDESKNKKYACPDGMKADLRSYQKEGTMWLASMKDNGFGALLADDMGLGKTLQVIALLAGWKERGKTLIVSPASLVYNWNSEIEKFMPDLPHRMIQGTSGTRKKLIETASENEILLTSYQTLQKDIELYENVHFSAQVIDEAQNIKNPSTITSKAVKLINADYKVALTGTPIENRLSELWSIFDYMMPGFFGSYETFRKTYERPIVKEGNEETSERLNQMISPFVLRRTS